MSAKLDLDVARHMILDPLVYGPRQFAAQLESALAEIERLRPVVDIAERWADSGSVHDEVLIDAIRAMRSARGRLEVVE